MGVMRFLQSKKWLLLGLLPMFFLANICSGKFMDRYTEPVYYYFIFSCCFLLLFLGAHFLFTQFKQTTFNIIDVLVFAYFGYVVIRYLYTADNYLKTDQLRVNLFYLVGYCFIRHLLSISENKKPHVFSSVFLLYSLGVLVSVVIGYLQYFGYLEGSNVLFELEGMLGNPTPFSNYIVTVIPLCLVICIWSNKKTRVDKLLFYYYLVLLILSLGIIGVTMARTAWLASLMCIAVVIVIRFYSHLKRLLNNRIRVVTVSAVFTIVLGLGVYGAYNIKKQSADSRLIIWKMSSELIKEKPLLGNGFQTYLSKQNENQIRHFETKSNIVDGYELYANNSFHPFNEFILILMEYGIIGLIFFLAMLVAVLVKVPVFKSINASSLSLYHFAAWLCIIAYLVMSLTSYPLKVLSTHFYFYLFIATVSSLTPLRKHSIKLPQLAYISMGVLLLLFAPYLFTKQHSIYKASLDWKKASNLITLKKTDESLALYEVVNEKLKNKIGFLYNYGATLNFLKENEKSNEVLLMAYPTLNNTLMLDCLGRNYKALGDYDKAEEMFTRSHNLVPYLIYSRYNLFHIYVETNRIDEAMLLADELTGTEPKVSNLRSDLMIANVYTAMDTLRTQINNKLNAIE